MWGGGVWEKKVTALPSHDFNKVVLGGRFWVVGEKKKYSEIKTSDDLFFSMGPDF